MVYQNKLIDPTVDVSRQRQARLLVSVRSAAEAGSALAGGCDILDIKEPDHGSLGMAAVDRIAGVVRVARESDRCPAVSVALGEVNDWRVSEVPILPDGLTYAKLGTSGLRGDSTWRATWHDVRERFCRASGYRFCWIAVAYADWQIAGAPSPQSVIEAAAEAGCVGVLIDTFYKGNKRLPDWIPWDQLSLLAERIHKHHMLIAVAGSLKATDLPRLMRVAPDIVAIRTAACVRGNRNGAVDADAVCAFREAVREHCPSSAAG